MIYADMFARLTIFVRITPLAFSVESYEVIIRDLTKFKSNSLTDVKTDLILSMLGCISHFLIALTSRSLQGRF